jgi:hypothetical protein
MFTSRNRNRRGVPPSEVSDIRISNVFRVGLHALRALDDRGVAAIPKFALRIFFP